MKKFFSLILLLCAVTIFSASAFGEMYLVIDEVKLGVRSDYVAGHVTDDLESYIDSFSMSSVGTIPVQVYKLVPVTLEQYEVPRNDPFCEKKIKWRIKGGH